MHRRALAVLLILASFYSLAHAENNPIQSSPAGFMELWNNLTYFDTNLEKKGFASLLGRFEGKLGFNFFNYPIQLYGAYYGTASQSRDYWNNSLVSGAGIRLRPFEGFSASGWMNEWINDTKIYAESLSIKYLMNEASAEADGLKDKDMRYGLEVWHEWNLKNVDLAVPWGELWANLSVRSTNFSSRESSATIFYLQPKFGRHIAPGIEAYLKADITYSNKDDYWLNIADYGVGIRFAPWRSGTDVYGLFRNFKMFAELLGVSYLKGQPAEAEPVKRVSTDARFGIDFSYGR